MDCKKLFRIINIIKYMNYVNKIRKNVWVYLYIIVDSDAFS